MSKNKVLKGQRWERHEDYHHLECQFRQKQVRTNKATSDDGTTNMSWTTRNKM
jgi:hypothetical protein